jgi:nitrogen regulatory protein P-II 1
MKKIEAIIRKSKFDEVRDALHDVNVYFFSYWDVTGVGHEKKEHLYRGVAYSSSDIQRRFLSIVVPVEEAYRIRTGESGGLTLK